MGKNEFFEPQLVGLFRSGRCHMVCVFWRIGCVLLAKKYGGKFSPDGSPDNARDGIETQVNRFRGQKAYNSNIRAKLLFLVPLPLLFAAIGELRVGDANGMLGELGAFILLIFWRHGSCVTVLAPKMRTTPARWPAPLQFRANSSQRS